MRTLPATAIIDAVADMCVNGNRHLPEDVRAALSAASGEETGKWSREIFRQLEENADLAAKTGLPLCQDTGMAVFFIELGQDLRIAGMSLTEAVNEGVRKGRREGNLRQSICHPLTRVNTGDNTPASLHVELVPGSALRILFLAKGGGSENMSRLAMLSPSQGWAGIREFVLRLVADGGANACPPLIIGLGIGGSFDTVPVLAKKALLRPLGTPNADPELADLERALLADVNKLGIGPMGLGGNTTALAVHIALAPCHIASLPVAANLQCHSCRRMERVL